MLKKIENILKIILFYYIFYYFITLIYIFIIAVFLTLTCILLWKVDK